jgi:hypothetical protein
MGIKVFQFTIPNYPDMETQHLDGINGRVNDNAGELGTDLVNEQPHRLSSQRWIVLNGLPHHGGLGKLQASSVIALIA